MFEIVAYAENAAETAGTNSSMGTQAMITQFIAFGVIILLLYFMMIRPQRKREKETKAMVAALKVGDKVTTIGGIVGKIVKVKDDYVVLETGSIGNTAEQSYVRMERSAIAKVEKKAEA